MSFFDENGWVGYADRDYRTMLQSIVLKTQDPINGIPEITDHNESNPFIKRIAIWCGIGEMLGYYIDNKGRESFLETARKFKSHISFARAYGYRVKGAVAATGEVTFTASQAVISNYTIPAGTVIKTDDDILFETLSDCIILTGTTSATVAIKQWVKANTLTFISNGQKKQTFILGENVVDGSVVVTINSNQYISVDTFVEANNNSEVFLHQINYYGKMEVLFGDGINGKIPITGQSIVIEYYTTSGAKGNIGTGIINSIVTILTPPTGAQLSVTNNIATTNGTDIESSQQIKKNIPLSVRTRYRAVTEQDFIDVAELTPGVAKAGISYSCSKFVDIYIAPNGGGIASPTLMNDTYLFVKERNIITVFPRINAAGQIIIEYDIRVKAKANFYNATVQATVIQNLLNFHSVENQRISGEVNIGDIYQVIENSVGVNNSQVLMMRPLPYARPLIASYPTLNWTRQQKQASVNSTYRITFINSAQFKLIRNNIYLGTFNIGITISTTDLDFTINPGLYVSGNAYEFKTYLVAGSITLNEPSLPAIDLSHLIITVTGGLI